MKVQVTFKDEKAIKIFKQIPRGLKGIALERALIEAIKKPTFAKLFLGENLDFSNEKKKDIPEKPKNSQEKDINHNQLKSNKQEDFNNDDVFSSW